METTLAPTPDEVVNARENANLTQQEAADLVKLSSFTRWSEYERGKRNMDPARFELFLIKTDQNPDFGPRQRRKAVRPSQGR